MLEDSSGWGEPDPPSTLRRPKAPTQPVRDDWEDDDDDEEEPQEEKNKKLWVKANHEAAAPMPTLIVSSTVASPPPIAAFQPSFKILKRPANDPDISPPNNPTFPKESLEERAARYQAARNRVFGVSASAPCGPDIFPTLLSANQTSVIVRNPRGPDRTPSTDTGPSKGFSTRLNTSTSESPRS